MDKSEKSSVLVVDDESSNIFILTDILTPAYDVRIAKNGRDAINTAEKYLPDIILLDIVMPEMDGYAVITELKKSEKTKNIPVIFLTSMTDPEDEINGLNLGAVDYIFKPFSRGLLLKHIELHLQLKRYSSDLEKMVEEKTHEVTTLKNAMIKTFAELVERRDTTTGKHIERTQNYLRLLINLLIEEDIYSEVLMTWDTELFVMSSQLHDVGKISIKDNILMKPDKLTFEEFDEMKKHSMFGREIVEKIREETMASTFLEHAKLLAESHHEKWDGSGYPFGLKKMEIPLQGRLMAIVDVYDALTNDRPYKKAFTHKEALELIKNGVGTHFDPLVCEAFIKYEKKFEAINNNYPA